MYSKNITTFLAHLLGSESGGIDLEDEIVKATCLAHGGKVMIDE
jgi:NAD/NADP transhydrogenase alpha subunit